MSKNASKKVSEVQWLDRALVLSPLCFGICITAKSFEAELDRLNVPKEGRPAFISNGAGATTHFLERADGSQSAIVCIIKPKEITRHQLNALLVHEAVHIWQETRSSLGEKSPSSEFEAYSVQSISQSLMEAFWNKSKG